MSRWSAQQVARMQAETCRDYHQACAETSQLPWPLSVLSPYRKRNAWHEKVAERYAFYEDMLKSCKGKECDKYIERMDTFSVNVAETIRYGTYYEDNVRDLEG